MPETRKQFEHNLWLLSEQKIHIRESSAHSIKGMREVKFAPNRRVNLHTVNEMARLMANTVFNFQQRNLKNDTEQQADI